MLCITSTYKVISLHARFELTFGLSFRSMQVLEYT